MGFVIGRRYVIGGKDTGKPRHRMAELTLSGAGKFVIRDEGKGIHSAVSKADEWGPAIVQGHSSLDVANRLERFLNEVAV